MMAERVGMAFESRCITLPLGKILPLRKLSFEPEKSRTYKRIEASVREIGLIEPLVVYPHDAKTGEYSLLDGHVRLEALKRLGVKEAVCLIATEDEAYTYNHKVNQISPIQEHFMILKAIESGVSEQRIATTLNVDIKSIRHKRDLLKNICPEAVALLKDRIVSAGAFRDMRRVKPMRQIEMAELMIAASNYSASYSKCLVAATPQEHILEPLRGKELGGLKLEEAGRMEKEMETLSREFLMIQESYGRNVLNLVLALAYLRKLLENAAVRKFLSLKHADLLSEFQKILETATLDGNTQ